MKEARIRSRQVADLPRIREAEPSEPETAILSIYTPTPHFSQLSHRFLIDTLMPVLYKARAFNESPDVSRK